jgi:hypothetical protein
VVPFDCASKGMEFLKPLGAASLAAAALTPVSFADITNFRDWMDANGVAANSTANTWYGLAGVGGPLLTPMTASFGSFWGYPPTSDDTPLLALEADVGSYGGAAGAATFNGSWVHAGPGIPAVLVFAPSQATYATGMNVRSELIANGLSGNGITISVATVIGGVTTDRGTATLSGTANDRLDLFSFGAGVTLGAGDKVLIVFGDNGNYQFDHANFNAWLGVPAPGALAVLAAVAAIPSRRRA